MGHGDGCVKSGEILYSSVAFFLCATAPASI
jgi:hypothetical protein